MKKQQMTSFYLEALLLVVVFVAMILVLTGAFGAARAQSVKAHRLTQAVTLASNAAEAAAASDSLDQAAALLDEGGNVRLTSDGLEAAYFFDGSPCAGGRGELRLSLSWERDAEEPDLVRNRIAIYAAEEETPLYTLETGRFRKGAAA